MAGEAQPLDQKFPIVDADGRPTLYFIEWAQQRQMDISSSVTEDQANDIVATYVSAHPPEWGSITGTLSAQADLQTALDAKMPYSVFEYLGLDGDGRANFVSIAGIGHPGGEIGFGVDDTVNGFPYYSFTNRDDTHWGAFGYPTVNDRYSLTGSHAWEFDLQPYYSTHPLFNETNLLVFTSVDDGLVPASGGVGTTHFLREDGTWAVPAGGGGGTTTHPVTFDVTGGAAPASTFDGSAAITVDYHTVGAAKTGLITASGLTSSATKKIVARKTAAGGALEEASISEILDFLGASQGDIAIRGSSGWILLGAGTAGYVLQTNGTGANPTWVPSGSTGASYEAGPPGSVPTAGGMTWVNQGAATAANGSRSLLLTVPSTVLRGLVQAAPAAPFDLYCRVDLVSLATAANVAINAGILLRNSATGNQISIHTENNTGQVRVGSFRWTTTGAFSATSSIPVTWTGHPIKWLRCNVTATTITMYISANGLDWISIGTEAIATFIGTVNQVGICASAGANSMAADFGYWSLTAPV